MYVVTIVLLGAYAISVLEYYLLFFCQSVLHPRERSVTCVVIKMYYVEKMQEIK